MSGEALIRRDDSESRCWQHETLSSRAYTAVLVSAKVGARLIGLHRLFYEADLH